MDLNKVGKFIAVSRKEKGLTQNKLAELLNVNEKTVSKWERGVNAPDISLLLNLSEILELDVQELLIGKKRELSDNNLKNNNEKTIEGLRYYSKKSKLRTAFYFLIIIFFILFCFSGLFFINNYNKFKVYSIKSNLDGFNVEGYVIYNRENNFVVINSIDYFDEFIGTDKELLVKNVKLSIYSANKNLYSYGYDFSDSSVEDNVKYNSISQILSNEKIFIVEEKNDKLNMFENIDLNNFYLKISFQKEDNTYENLVIPLIIKKEYSNSNLL